MCRQNRLWAVAAIALGVGMLLGSQLESGLGTGILAWGAIVFGISRLWKK